MSSKLPSWAIVVPQSAENKEEPLRQFVELLQDKCSRKGLELPHPFVYLWEDITQDTLSGLDDFVDGLLRAKFDFVLCVYNTGFDGGQLPRVRGDLQSAEYSALYLPFEEIENIAVVGEVLRAMSNCFDLRRSLAFERIASPSQQNVCGGALRTFMGRTTTSQDDFTIIAKDGVSLGTTKEAARKSHRLSYLLKEGKASASCESDDAGLLLLGVQWLEYADSPSYGCFIGRAHVTGALNACTCCKPNVYQARILDYNQHRWWDLITASAAPLNAMRRALAGRIANVAPPSHLKDLYNNNRDSRSSTASWSRVASSIGSIPMPPELSDGVLLGVVRSYSSHYPSFQWAEEFASVSPQWKHVIDTNKHLLPRLLVDTVKVRGCQIDIRLEANDPQPATDGLPQPLTISNHQVANTAATLRRIAARRLIISLEEPETLEKLLVCVGSGGLRAVSITLEPPEYPFDVNIAQIMRAIGEADRLRAKVTCSRDIEALLPDFPRHVCTFEMDLGSCRPLEDDSLLDALLYFANRMMVRDFVIEHYHSDVVELADRIAKEFSSRNASRLDVLVVPVCRISPVSKRDVQTTIALNIRRSDGRRYVAVHEGCGMRMIIGDDRAVNERMSRRKDYDALLPLLERGSGAFEKLENAVYATLFSETVGYSDLNRLLNDLGEDSDIDGEQEVRRFAYASFPDFLRSAEMKSRVNVTEDSSGKTVYEAIPTVETIHLRWEQQKSAVNVAERAAKTAKNAESDARRKVFELERRQRNTVALERRVRELEMHVRYRDDIIHQQSAALAEAQRKIRCPICLNAPIEVVFNCGHGTCRVCAEKETHEERSEPGTSQFSVNGPTTRVPKADPKCSYCKQSLNLCVDFYPFRS